MFNTRFGTEIEFTGITRNVAAKVVTRLLDGVITHIGGCYDTYEVKAPDGRIWKLMRDGSIRCQRKARNIKVSATHEYSVELVSPILTYNNDIATLQEIVRQLRHSGAFVNHTCGIHIHIDGASHTVKSIKNFIKIIYARNDLFYKALDINNERKNYCKKFDLRLVSELKNKNPKTMAELENIWYDGYYGCRNNHYHNSRYHFLNLHSFFNGHHTVELRGFNSTMHAGELRAYIVFALALNHQALTQKSASTKKPQTDNEKFAMRTYLNRIGLIGDEFKACREHLTKHLNGSSAWRHKAA